LIEADTIYITRQHNFSHRTPATRATLSSITREFAESCRLQARLQER
jgi:hypothetical protein